MKPLLINTFDSGGAAKACIRLHEALLLQKIDSWIQFLYHKNPEIENAFTCGSLIEKPNDIASKILRFISNINSKKNKDFLLEQKFLQNRSKDLEMFSFPYSRFDISKSEIYNKSDIIHLHWVANYLHYEHFFSKNTKPVVWTLHDMNPFTGGEHYKEMIVGIDEKGFPKKRELNKDEIFYSKKNLEIKKKALEHIKKLHIIAPSHWLQKEAFHSSLFSNYPVSYIPYCLNTEVFKPFHKKIAKEFLNLPTDKINILFVADSIDNKRKGFDYLSHAIAQLPEKEIHFCVVGLYEQRFTKKNNISYLGKIQDERLMSLVYSAADAFVIPSIMDNLPNTVIESLSCGTPVIGFPVGGILEMVQNNINGYFTKKISVEDLIETITFFISNNSQFNQISISKKAHAIYNPDLQARSYISLYKKILESH